MSIPDKTIFRGDTPTFVFTITDEAGAAVDLTDITTIKFIAKKSDEQPDADAQFNVACTVDSPATDGICRVKLSSTNTDTAGTFLAELMLNFLTAATTLTAQRVNLIITADLHQADT